MVSHGPHAKIRAHSLFCWSWDVVEPWEVRPEPGLQLTEGLFSPTPTRNAATGPRLWGDQGLLKSLQLWTKISIALPKSITPGIVVRESWASQCNMEALVLNTCSVVYSYPCSWILLKYPVWTQGFDKSQLMDGTWNYS